MPKKLTMSLFCEELIQIMPSIARFSHSILGRKSDAFTQGKITLPQYLALNIINSGGSLKMKDIAKLLHISLPAVTGLISRLVGMKMAKRVYNQKDRRVIYVTLTSLGKKTTEQVKIVRKKVIEKVFSDISSNEREIYLNIMQKVKEKLYEKSGEGE